jgi:AtzE family amidohydrolase
MSLDLRQADAIAIATAIRTGALTATSVIKTTLERIAAEDSLLNSFTTVLSEQALAKAAEVERAIAAGQQLGPLAGVPFAVKNLFDVAGEITLAGSKINRDNPPAQQDATSVAALKRAGAILVGMQNMDEYAYGFVTENSHYGPTHNPHDLARIAGGSSGGSAAAVAAGLVPLSLGTDTNGSIRVPAALCGIWGLKPTYGRLSRAGVFPFVSSLDHIGPFARSVRDMALAFDLMQGPDPHDPVCTTRPAIPCLTELTKGIDGLRVAIAADYFAQGAEPAVLAAVEQVAQALGAKQQVILPEAQRARAAAYVITACEGSTLHLHNLKTRIHDFDPATRDRFLAGAMIPASWYLQAQQFRRWYRDRVREVLQTVDVIIAPTTPCSAPLIGQETIVINGIEVPNRPNLGYFTQPISFIGLPVVAVPIQRSDALPIGVQLIAAPYQEASLLRTAAFLETQGIAAAPAVNLTDKN